MKHPEISTFHHESARLDFKTSTEVGLPKSPAIKPHEAKTLHPNMALARHQKESVTRLELNELHDSKAVEKIAIENTPEKSVTDEKSLEKKISVEHARNDVEKATSVKVEKNEAEKTKPSPELARRAVQRITSAEKKRIYRQTIKRTQAEMSAVPRAFSRLIHARGIEQASDVLASSLARPNAILYGSSAALVLLGFTYAISQFYGYRLSGFEVIGAYSIGWLIGVFVDYVKLLASGRRLSL